MTDRVAEVRLDPRGASRCHGRDQRAVIREALLDGTHQRHGRLHFAHGHGVDPDASIEFWVTDTEALAQAIAIAPVEKRANQEVDPQGNLENIDQQIVENTHSCARGSAPA